MKIQTPCKNCCFATYSGITQIGCDAGRLEKFENIGTDIIEAYDEEKEFKVINRRCQYYREAKWPFSNNTNRLEHARKECDIKCQVICVAHNTANTLATLDGIINQTFQPRHISLINPKNNVIDLTKIRNLLQTSGIHWRIFVLQEDVKEYEIHVLRKVRYPFIWRVDSPVVPKPTTLEILNENINDKYIEDIRYYNDTPVFYSNLQYNFGYEKFNCLQIEKEIPDYDIGN